MNNINTAQYKEDTEDTTRGDIIRTRRALRALAPETTRQREVLGLDGDALGVNGREVRVLEE